MGINRKFEIGYTVNSKTLKGSVIFEVKEQYKIPVKYFLPSIFYSYCERLYDLDSNTDYQASDLPYFLTMPSNGIELVWLYPKKKCRIAIYLERGVCIHAVYKAASEFYDTYKDHEDFQEDMQRLEKSLGKLREQYNDILEDPPT
jgi:hypothetical protein